MIDQTPIRLRLKLVLFNLAAAMPLWWKRAYFSLGDLNPNSRASLRDLLKNFACQFRVSIPRQPLKD